MNVLCVGLRYKFCHWLANRIVSFNYIDTAACDSCYLLIYSKLHTAAYNVLGVTSKTFVVIALHGYTASANEANVLIVVVFEMKLLKSNEVLLILWHFVVSMIRSFDKIVKWQNKQFQLN